MHIERVSSTFCMVCVWNAPSSINTLHRTSLSFVKCGSVLMSFSFIQGPHCPPHWVGLHTSGLHPVLQRQTGQTVWHRACNHLSIYEWISVLYGWIIELPTMWKYNTFDIQIWHLGGWNVPWSCAHRHFRILSSTTQYNWKSDTRCRHHCVGLGRHPPKRLLKEPTLFAPWAIFTLSRCLDSPACENTTQ